MAQLRTVLCQYAPQKHKREWYVNAPSERLICNSDAVLFVAVRDSLKTGDLYALDGF